MSRCPRSEISADSLRWLELYSALQGNHNKTLDWNARDAEAMVLIDRWQHEEQANG